MKENLVLAIMVIATTTMVLMGCTTLTKQNKIYDDYTECHKKIEKMLDMEFDKKVKEAELYIKLAEKENEIVRLTMMMSDMKKELYECMGEEETTTKDKGGN